MGIFENILGNWIQVIDEENNLTIEDYGYETGVIIGTTDRHCVKCVAVNRCYFKNEQDKKPSSFPITGINFVDKVINGILSGLYHPFCHCSENPAEINQIDEINLIIPPGKIDYLFRSKSEWVEAMGYHKNDRESFVQILLNKTKEAYFFGKYEIENLTKYGCKVNLNLSIPGQNEKQGKQYKIKTNYMIFPNKKLKMNTPIGGWQK